MTLSPNQMSGNDGEDEDRPPLPIIPCVGWSFQLLKDHHRVGERLGAIPMLVLALGITLTGAANYPFLEGTTFEAGVAVMLAGLLMAIPVLTAWHRLGIYGQGNPAHPMKYKWGLEETGYVVRAIMLGLILIGLSIPLSVLAAIFAGFFGGGLEQNALMAGALVNILAFYLAARFMLVFPAVALGHKFGFKDAWRATKGNGIRILSVIFIAALPFAIIDILLTMFSVTLVESLGGGGSGAFALTVLLKAFSQGASMLIGTSVLTYAYRHLVGEIRKRPLQFGGPAPE